MMEVVCGRPEVRSVGFWPDKRALKARICARVHSSVSDFGRGPIPEVATRSAYSRRDLPNRPHCQSRSQTNEISSNPSSTSGRVGVGPARDDPQKQHLAERATLQKHTTPGDCFAILIWAGRLGAAESKTGGRQELGSWAGGGVGFHRGRARAVGNVGPELEGPSRSILAPQSVDAICTPFLATERVGEREALALPCESDRRPWRGRA